MVRHNGLRIWLGSILIPKIRHRDGWSHLPYSVGALEFKDMASFSICLLTEVEIANAPSSSLVVCISNRTGCCITGTMMVVGCQNAGVVLSCSSTPSLFSGAPGLQCRFPSDDPGKLSSSEVTDFMIAMLLKNLNLNVKIYIFCNHFRLAFLL